MKKLLLFAAILFVAPVWAQLEFQVETPSGDLINEGDVVAFNVLTSPEAYLNFFVRNLSTSPINMKITTRSDLQFAAQAIKAMPKPRVFGSSHPFADDDLWR